MKPNFKNIDINLVLVCNEDVFIEAFAMHQHGYEYLIATGLLHLKMRTQIYPRQKRGQVVITKYDLKENNGRCNYKTRKKLE